MHAAKYVQMIRVLDIEQRERKSTQRPMPQLRNVQFVRIAWRTGGWMPFDLPNGALQRSNEIAGDVRRFA